jgi:hypothetical protein
MEKKLKTQRVFLHNHSTWSDGHMSLSAIARLGKRLGASAVVMSEHDFDFTPSKWDDYVLACHEASIPECTVIPGIEYSSPNDDIHVVTMGASRFHGARGDLLETLSAVRSEGGAAVLAHPRRRDAFNKVNDLLELLDGIEIWNRKVDGLRPVDAYFKLARSRALAPIVAMDLHTWRQVFPMWNEIAMNSELIDGNTIARALRERRIVPACIVGHLEPGLDGAFSPALSSLVAAEQLRRLLRYVRDTVRPR